MTNDELQKMLEGQVITDVDLVNIDCFGKNIADQDSCIIQSLYLSNGVRLVFYASSQIERDDVYVRVEL